MISHLNNKQTNKQDIFFSIPRSTPFAQKSGGFELQRDENIGPSLRRALESIEQMVKRCHVSWADAIALSGAAVSWLCQGQNPLFFERELLWFKGVWWFEVSKSKEMLFICVFIMMLGVGELCDHLLQLLFKSLQRFYVSDGFIWLGLLILTTIWPIFFFTGPWATTGWKALRWGSQVVEALGGPKIDLSLGRFDAPRADAPKRLPEGGLTAGTWGVWCFLFRFLCFFGFKPLFQNDCFSWLILKPKASNTFKPIVMLYTALFNAFKRGSVCSGVLFGGTQSPGRSIARLFPTAGPQRWRTGGFAGRPHAGSMDLPTGRFR